MLKVIPVEEAVGLPLAHDITEIGVAVVGSRPVGHSRRAITAADTSLPGPDQGAGAGQAVAAVQRRDDRDRADRRLVRRLSAGR